MPEAHVRHASTLLDPLALLNRPRGHNVGCAVAKVQKLPAGQETQAENELAPLAELKRPAGQLVGAAIPVALQYAAGLHWPHAAMLFDPTLGLKLDREPRSARARGHA